MTPGKGFSRATAFRVRVGNTWSQEAVTKEPIPGVLICDEKGDRQRGMTIKRVLTACVDMTIITIVYK